MLTRQAIQSRLDEASLRPVDGLDVRLPLSLKGDRSGVKIGLLKRLASSMTFSLGARAGALRTAQNRSGRAFRVDVRQRVIVKALVSRHLGKGAERGAALARHVAYLGRAGAGAEGLRAAFFDRDADGPDANAVTGSWETDRHHFRFIISPEHGDRIDDLRSYVRDVMGRVAADLGQPELAWIATCHFDTDQPHAHVLVRGRRTDGKDLVIPRDYMGYGFRARAQEVAQERLGDLSRVDAERRIWRETQADRFTGFDRRLLSAADSENRVEDGEGSGDAWAALTRGRLRYLESLGLAEKSGSRYRLAPDLEQRLRGLQVKRDIIRTLNQRRLEGGQEVRLLGAERVTGRVVKSGFHDEVGSSPWAIVRSADGVEHYGRLRAGSPPLQVGMTITMDGRAGGLAEVSRGKGADLGL
jgi:type IV secretory pathway VirD2 relaxase